MENSITICEELRKYFYDSGLNFLSSVPQRRIQEMILAMAQKGHSGKMTDCGKLGAGHRTTYGHFLSKGKWDHAEELCLFFDTRLQLKIHKDFRG